MCLQLHPSYSHRLPKSIGTRRHCSMTLPTAAYVGCLLHRHAPARHQGRCGTGWFCVAQDEQPSDEHVVGTCVERIRSKRGSNGSHSSPHRAGISTAKPEHPASRNGCTTKASAGTAPERCLLPRASSWQQGCNPAGKLRGQCKASQATLLTSCPLPPLHQAQRPEQRRLPPHAHTCS